MCGIAGGTHLNPESIEAALSALRHRGPDSQDAWTSPDGHVTLGHARLAIIDLSSAANQPMKCSRTGNMVAFNGEIYNFRAVRQELSGLGWEFRTKSDTEVLLAAYGQWGADCLSRLNGMFALTLYDAARRKIFLARDRIGKRPLYYTLHGGAITWASEIKGILALRPDLPRIIDRNALNEYMQIGYIPGELSIYRNIRKLPAAHFAFYDVEAGELQTPRRYWALQPPGAEDVDDAETAERFEALLEDAVKIRLESDVPVGILLSGGLDSSLVAAMAARANSSLVAYTAQFAEAKYDETATAARVAEWIGVKHCVAPVDSADMRHLFCLGEQFDEPLADSSLLPTYLVSRAIRKHVTVALTGDGGDELFGGYGLYRQVQNERKWERMPQWLRKLLSPAHHLLPIGTPGKNFLRRLTCDGAARYRAVTGAAELVAKSPLIEEVAARLRGLPTDAYRTALEGALPLGSENCSMSLLQQMTRIDFGSWLVDDVLVKADRASMLTALELRSPLLDYRIAELAYGLPDRLRCDTTGRKVLLKRVAGKYLPPDFPFERKMAFNIPETEWFLADWRPMLREVAKEGSGLLDAKRVESIENAHLATRRYGRELFKILMLAMFSRYYGGVVE